jgi:hypothetical protein
MQLTQLFIKAAFCQRSRFSGFETSRFQRRPLKSPAALGLHAGDGNGERRP